MTMSYLSMASPSELLRSRCPLPTTTQRQHLRLRGAEGAQIQKWALLPPWVCLAWPGTLPRAPSAPVPTDQPSAQSPVYGPANSEPRVLLPKRKLSRGWKREEGRREDG